MTLCPVLCLLDFQLIWEKWLLFAFSTGWFDKFGSFQCIAQALRLLGVNFSNQWKTPSVIFLWLFHLPAFIILSVLNSFHILQLFAPSRDLWFLNASRNPHFWLLFSAWKKAPVLSGEKLNWFFILLGTNKIQSIPSGH